MSPATNQALTEYSLSAGAVSFALNNWRMTVACVPFIVILYKVVKALLDPLRSVPGPFLARFTNLWLFAGFWSRKWHDINYDIHQKYGTIVRVAPDQYSIDDAEAIKTIYGYGYKFLKSSWYKPFSFKSDGLFSVRDPTYHALLRRKVNAVYSMTAMVTYEPYVKECAQMVLDHVHSFSSTGEMMDMMHWSQCFSFDVVGMITFSHRFGFLDRGQDEMGFIEAIARSSRISMLLGVYPFLFPWIHIFLGLFFNQRRAVKTLAAYSEEQMASAKRRIEEEKRANPDGKINPANENAPQDFITKLLRIEEDQDSRKGVTKTEIQMSATQNMAAGSDTTGISITSVIYHLTKHPRTLEKLRRELDEAAKANDCSDYVLPFSIVQKLPYLQAVIKEAERVHPAAGVPLPRIVPPEGAWLGGRFFPGGTTVMVHAWTSHRNKAVWGADADTFNPERWIEDGNAPSETQFLTFGQGTRICVGKNIASMQLNMLVPALVANYDFELVPGKHDERLNADSAVFARPYNVMFTVRKRT